MSTDQTKPSQLRVVFAGTPDFAAVALQRLIQAGVQICAVYCQPDRPSGRGKKLIHGPVKTLALANNIPVEQPLNFKQAVDIETLANYQADMMIVAAYGLLLPVAVLETPKFGCINIHGSILPRWRGAAPIQRAIQAGDKETGITIMQMDKGLDTGDMLLKRVCPITDEETGSSLHDKLAELGGDAILTFLNSFDGQANGEKQADELATYAHKLSKQEASIDWSQSATQIEQQIRAFNAWPVCFTYIKEKRLRVWQSEIVQHTSNLPFGTVYEANKNGIDVVCGDGQFLRLTRLQPDGSKAMDAAALLNARKEWFENQPLLTSAPSV